MKYTYAYKTSDGVRHEDSMNAASRDEVFEKLRRQGIRAIKVVAADGSKANGEIRGVRKRMVAVLVAIAALLVGIVAYFCGSHLAEPEQRAKASPRHQIYGDPAIMEILERGDFKAYLPNEGDCLLAIFAQPGKLMCAKGTKPAVLGSLALESGQNAVAVFSQYAKEELDIEKDITIGAGDVREIRELKQIVNGMRQEMREYLANGNGTALSYWRRINERTRTEIKIYERTQRELEKEAKLEIWDQKNEALRRLGLRPIPYPSE